MSDWITATPRRDYDTGKVTIIHPDPYPGVDGDDRLEVEQVVDGEMCGIELYENGRWFTCGLVAGHVPLAHWQCTPELIAETGPMQIVAVMESL